MEQRTDRLLLRKFRADDIDAYAEMCADPEVMRFLNATGEPLSRSDAWRQMAMFTGHWELRGYGMWVAEEAGGGAFDDPDGRRGTERLQAGWEEPTSSYGGRAWAESAGVG